MAKGLPKTIYVYEEQDNDDGSSTYFIADRTLDDVAPGVGEKRVVAMYERKAVVTVTTKTEAKPTKRR